MGGGPKSPSKIMHSKSPGHHQPPPSAGGPEAKSLSAFTSSSVVWDCDKHPNPHRTGWKEATSQDPQKGSDLPEVTQSAIRRARTKVKCYEKLMNKQYVNPHNRIFGK